MTACPRARSNFPVDSWAKQCNIITRLEHNRVELTDFANRSLTLWSPVGPILYRAMEPSAEEARQYLNGRKFDGYVFSDLTRYHTCCRLESTALPRGITFQRLQNNGISFSCDGSIARVWKADEAGELRGPGGSKIKREYFDQEFLLFSPEPSQARYAILWEYDLSTGLLTFSLACPKQFDQYKPWNNPECHFSIALPHAATGISASPAFSEVAAENEIELKPKRNVQDLNESPNNDSSND